MRKDWKYHKRELASDAFYGLELYIATLIGHVPNHALRNTYYRHALGLRLDPSAIIYWGARFMAPDRITVGSNTIVGDHVFLDGRRGISVGSSVNIASGVSVYTQEHDPDTADFGITGGPVIIGDYAAVGSRAVILPGVIVAEGAVIGAGAVVSRSIPPWTIAVGVPARPIRQRPQASYTLDTKRRAWFQ